MKSSYSSISGKLATIAAVWGLAQPLAAHPGHSEPQRALFNETETEAAAISEEGEMQNLPESFNFTVEHAGKTHELCLHKRSVRAADFRIVVQNGSGEDIEVPCGPVRTYSGFLADDPGSRIAASVKADGLSATIRCSNGRCFKVIPPTEPGGSYTTADFELDPTQEGLTPAQLDSAARALSEPIAFAESSQQIQPAALTSGRKESADLRRVTPGFAVPNTVSVKQAKIGFQLSNNAFNRFSAANDTARREKAIQAVEDFVNDSLNLVYISDILVEHVIGTIRIDEVRGTGGQDFDSGTRGTLLSRFRNFWNGFDAANQPAKHDLAYLLVNHDIEVFGLAFVGTVGGSARYGMGRFTGGESFSGVARHEISHIWAMGHGNGCGLEVLPGGGLFSVGMCTGDGRKSNSNESGIARGHRNSRGNGVLDDIGAFPTPQEPYCPLDRFSTVVGGARIRLDVLRNDFDANNDGIRIVEIRTASQQNLNITNDGNTSLGGTVSISAGTGPGGRDQINYTPPSELTGIANVDHFLYIVEDETGLRQSGNVRVTLGDNIQPEPVSPCLFLADSIEQFSTEANPNGIWSYGFFESGSSAFQLSDSLGGDDPAIIGGDGSTWDGVDSARVGQFAQLPGASTDAVRRWRSNYTGKAVVEYTVAKLDIPLTEPGISFNAGETARIALNGTTLWQSNVAVGDIFSGRLEVDLDLLDTIDAINSSGGDAETDGLYFHLRIVPDYHANLDDDLLFHFTFDTGSNEPEVRRSRATDVSGNNRHATVENIDGGSHYQPAQIQNGLKTDGSDQSMRLDDSGLGNGSDAITMSIWFNADGIGANDGIMTSDGNYFGLTFRGAIDTNPLEFRAQSSSIIAPLTNKDDMIGRWIHVVGTWERGQHQRIYVDGELANERTTSIPTVNIAGITEWRIGRDRAIGGRGFNGLTDDAAVWTRALTPEEVRALHAKGRTAQGFANRASHTETIPVSPVADGSSSVTLAAWVQPDALGANDGIVTVNGDSSYFALLSKGTEGNPPEFRGNNDSNFGSAFTIGERQHLAATWTSGEESILYLNGQEIARKAANNGPVNFDRWQLGQDRSIDNRFWDGEIGEVLISGREFSAAEIRQLFLKRPIGWNAQAGFITHISEIGSFSDSPELRDAADIHTLTGGGTGFGSTDNLAFASRTATTADVDFGARVLYTAGTGNSRSGIMVRRGLGANAPFAALYRDSVGVIRWSSRSATGASVQTSLSTTGSAEETPFFRIVRSGSGYDLQVSTDGASYTTLTNVTVPGSGEEHVGIFHFSGSNSSRSAAQFSDLIFDPGSLDSDMDGLVDSAEILFFGDLTSSSGGPDEDFDNDGISDRDELNSATNPTLADTDGDGLNDGDELLVHNTNPLVQDTDGDGLLDGEEIFTTRSNPTLADSDGDGLNDRLEVQAGSNPLDVNSLPIVAAPSQLRGYWEFERPASGTPGGIAEDTTGNNDGFWRDSLGNDTSGLSYEGGRIGDSARMPGGENRAFFLRRDPIAGSEDVTIMGWFRLREDETDYSGIMTLRRTDNSEPWGMNINVNQMDFRAKGTGYRSENIIFAQLGWIHAAMTLDKEGSNTVLSMYVNGRLIRQENVANLTYNTDASLRWEFGDDNGGRFRVLGGNIDEFAMFNTALTPAQIAVVHAAGNEGIGLGALVSVRPPEQIDFVMSGNSSSVRFDAQDGVTYQVLGTDDLTLPISSWQTVSTINGNGSAVNVPINRNTYGDEHFFVVRVAP